MEDDLKKKFKTWKTTKKKKKKDDQNKMEDKPINIIGCDTIVNSPSYAHYWEDSWCQPQDNNHNQPSVIPMKRLNYSESAWDL